LKLTNIHNLPETFVNILRRPSYTKGGANISATELINSPRIVQLKRLNEEHLEEDVSDRIWAIFGTAIHAVLEHGKDHNHLVEERLHAVLDGWSISGAIDLQIVEDGGIRVSDYKTVSVWSVMNEKIEWEQQLNIYAWLVETVKKVPVTGLSIVAIIRDWNRRESTLKEEYPNAPVKEIEITVWPYEERTKFIQGRLRKHSEALLAAETKEDLPQCTAEEVWEKPTTWAIKKVGGVRAKKVCYTEEEANDELEKAGKGYAIEVRPGGRTRCENYCPVRDFCGQWKDYNSGKE
jgi:RecB family exonuclease